MEEPLGAQGFLNLSIIAFPAALKCSLAIIFGMAEVEFLLYNAIMGQVIYLVILSHLSSKELRAIFLIPCSPLYSSNDRRS